MEPKDFNKKLDGIIDDSLRQPPGFIIPDTFTDDLVKRLEKHLAWKELLSEFGLKSALVAGALIVLLICLIFPAKNDPMPWIKWIANNRVLVAGTISVILFTFVFDQLLLKYLFGRSQRLQNG